MQYPTQADGVGAAGQFPDRMIDPFSFEFLLVFVSDSPSLAARAASPYKAQVCEKRDQIRGRNEKGICSYRHATRDLKPVNIMLHCPGGEDHVKPIDCGIGGIQNSQFRAPCAASETYALGAMAYEILTGTLRGDPKESRPKLREAAEGSVRMGMSFRPELAMPRPANSARSCTML
jgi:hypothetical protein